VWHRSIYRAFFLTVTSAPDSDPDLLRLHFQYLRHRIAKHLGIPRPLLEYICVSTREGHGVIHSVIGVPASVVPRSGHLVPFDTLQAWWKEIHGAFMVNVKAIRRTSTDRRKVAGYIVAQYLANQQGAYLRLSQSRSIINWRQQREDFRAFSWPLRWNIVTRRNRLSPIPANPVLFECRHAAWRKWCWRRWREALRKLLADGGCALWGRLFLIDPETGRIRYGDPPTPGGWSEIQWKEVAPLFQG